MTYKQWDVVVVPFPFVDAPSSKKRPVIILSKNDFNSGNQHVIAAMVTSSMRQGWEGDITLHDIHSAGLNKPCIIRLKLFTLDERLILKKTGTLCAHDQQQLQQSLKQYLG